MIDTDETSHVLCGYYSLVRSLWVDVKFVNFRMVVTFILLAIKPFSMTRISVGERV